MSEQAAVKMGVTVTKNPGRGSGYTAAYGRYPYCIEARGATQAEAKANLTAALATALDTMLTSKPGFASDDQGGMWAAIPAYDGGSNWYRVTQDSARRNANSSQPASEAFTGCVGFTMLPLR